MLLTAAAEDFLSQKNPRPKKLNKNKTKPPPQNNDIPTLPPATFLPKTSRWEGGKKTLNIFAFTFFNY